MLKFIKLESATKVEDLTALTYRLRSNVADSTLTAASEALLLANPALRNVKKIPSGTVVLVPDLDGKLPPAKEAQPVEIPLGRSGLLTDRQIASLASEAAEAAKTAKERSAETATVIKAARKTIGEQAPGAEEMLERILESAKAKYESVQKSEKSGRKVFDRMAADMKKLRDL